MGCDIEFLNIEKSVPKERKSRFLFLEAGFFFAILYRFLP